MIRRIIVASYFASAFLGCPPPPVPAPDLRGDAGADGCALACAALASETCPEGGPTSLGVSCVEVCQIAPEMLPVACVAAAKSVDQIRACGVRCKR